MKHQYGQTEKAKREAQTKADATHEPFAVVSEGLSIEIRPLRKALAWASKNANVRIVIEINPTNAS